jgi:hypothetical protein
VQSVQWRGSATYTDSSGRTANVDSTILTVEPPVAAQPPSVGGAGGTRILLFGGRNNAVFLGCLTCSRFDSDSVLNSYGSYGSRYSSTSIWNRFSDYGGQFSNFSACNQFATQPPIIVDDRGNYLADMTINRFSRGAVPALITWLQTEVCN